MTRYNIDKVLLHNVSISLRIKTLEAIYRAQSGHIGSSLSMSEILACLFFKIMKYDKGNENNDKFILSKGHGVPILYAVYQELGWISMDELLTLRKINSKLQGHPDMTIFKYFDAGTGALGQGISIAIGYALAFKLDNKTSNVFCVIGDGEMQEGQIWEAAMYIGSKKIDNICVIIDNNKFQNERSVKETLDFYPVKNKWESFGWDCIDINGHSVDEIISAFNIFKSNNKPTVIIANTIKGSGVDFMENKSEWHSKNLDKSNYEKAIKQLESKYIK